MQLLIYLFGLLAAASAGWSEGLIGGYMNPIKPGIVGYGYAGPYRGYAGLGYGGHPELDAVAALQGPVSVDYGRYTASLRPGYGIVNGYTAPPLGRPFDVLANLVAPTTVKPIIPIRSGKYGKRTYTNIWQ